jgi:hypothetical protein
MFHKKFVAIVLSAFTLTAFNASALDCSSANVDQAAKTYDAAVAGFSAKTSSILDVKLAKLALLDLTICAKRMSAATYCVQKPKTLAEVDVQLSKGDEPRMLSLPDAATLEESESIYKLNCQPKVATP